MSETEATTCTTCGVASDAKPPHRVQHPRCPRVIGVPPRLRFTEWEQDIPRGSEHG